MPPAPAAAAPAVSVVLSTYNWSSVLRYAIRSVLAQTLRDFELIVVGDCCTDDSEAVVRSFDDPRVQWHNLPQNCGNQFGPNNHGVALARGRYVAYLGHDDLWHAEHLAVLVKAIEAREADLVFALSEEIGPPQMPTRQLLGLCPRGHYESSIWAPPSSWLHRRDLLDRVGPWRNPRTLVVPTDPDLLGRIYDQGCRIVPVDTLTVFKFTAGLRNDCYVERRCDEQAQWWERLQQDPSLRERELVAIVRGIGHKHPDVYTRFLLPGRVRSGSMTAASRARRGLAPYVEETSENADATPLYNDRPMLRYLNAVEDIGPADDRRALHEGGALPRDGLFVGLNWHSLETYGDGTRWRWIDTDAQIVVTAPSGARRRLLIDLRRGPGIRTFGCRLQARDASGAVIAQARVPKLGWLTRRQVTLDLPLAEGAGAIVSLSTEDGGRAIGGDPRILNFRVFGFRWADAA